MYLVAKRIICAPPCEVKSGSAFTGLVSFNTRIPFRRTHLGKLAMQFNVLGRTLRRTPSHVLNRVAHWMRLGALSPNRAYATARPSRHDGAASHTHPQRTPIISAAAERHAANTTSFDRATCRAPALGKASPNAGACLTRRVHQLLTPADYTRCYVDVAQNIKDPLSMQSSVTHTLSKWSAKRNLPIYWQ